MERTCVWRLLARAGWVALAIVTAVVGTVVPAEAAQPGLRWVALGDSYSAGAGVAGGEGHPCYRNQTVNWALEAKNALSKTWPTENWSFFACTGATLDDIYGGGARANGSLPKQIDHIGPSTNVVTLTGGGNDVGFADVIRNCTAWARLLALPALETCPHIPVDTIPAQPGFTTASRKNWDAIYDELVHTYVSVQSKMSPAGQLYVLTYPLFFANPNDWGVQSKATGCEAVWGANSARRVNQGIIRLGDTIYWAVQEANRLLSAAGRPGRVVFVDQRATNSMADPWDPNGLCGGYSHELTARQRIYDYGLSPPVPSHEVGLPASGPDHGSGHAT